MGNLIAANRSRRGFTLVELLVVMVIISILLGFILKAGMAAVRSAQVQATQALITKLEVALNDRLDALNQTRPDPASAHYYLAQVYNSGYYPNQNLPPTYGAMRGDLRAQTIAWYDYIKREMPDVFFVQNTTGPYPINFAANAWVGNSAYLGPLGNYVLPMGNAIYAPNGDVPAPPIMPLSGVSSATYNPAGSGIYGASYGAAAGIYKNLGYIPIGYDGVDNNGNGMIDDWSEGVNSSNQAIVMAHLSNHTHNTARAEMLYAILVEGRGPLGSVFNKDDFSSSEVADTDDDGLPEFVDAWGNPLQFFRWPLLYHSDIQRGQVIVQSNATSTTSSTNPGGTAWTLFPPYANPAEPASLFNAMQVREQDPLDVNQQLMAPAWWSSLYNNATPFSLPVTTPAAGEGGSVPALPFEYYFYRLSEPFPVASIKVPGVLWDRGTTYIGRRAFYSKFLILSGGLDGLPGVFIYSQADLNHYLSNGTMAWALIANENLALPFSASPVANGFVDFTGSGFYSQTTIPYNSSTFNDTTQPSSSDLLQAAQDDISNQTMAGGTGGGR